YLATGDRPGRRTEIRGRAGATVTDPSRTSDRDGPEPGHLTLRRAQRARGGALGANGRPEERSNDERTRPKRRQGPRRSAKAALSRKTERELGRRLEERPQTLLEQARVEDGARGLGTLRLGLR